MTDKMTPRGRTASETPEDILAAIRDIQEPCFGTGEVAEVLAVGPERTRQLLNQLVKDGPLSSKLIGNTTVYWVDGY
jgi:Mn-dependent DtxR family transcriptional regulator